MNFNIIIGGTGSGKSYLGKVLLENDYVEVISTTTRPPREDEVDGVTYNFIKDAEMSNHSFVEYTTVGEYKYGVTIKEMFKAMRTGKNFFVIVEPYGLVQIINWLNNNYREVLNTIKDDLNIKIVHLNVQYEIRLLRLLRNNLKTMKIQEAYLNAVKRISRNNDNIDHEMIKLLNEAGNNKVNSFTKDIFDRVKNITHIIEDKTYKYEQMLALINFSSDFNTVDDLDELTDSDYIDLLNAYKIL